MKRLIDRLSLFKPTPPPPADKALWSIGLYSGASPLALGPDDAIRNPILAREAVTDVSAAFVADPFLFHREQSWYLFFEVLNRQNRRGEIGLATSPDLATWRYQRIVLREPFHLSYPQVFGWQGEIYMVPETHQTKTIRLYRADPFPDRWSLVHTLISGRPFADTTLFRHADRWWLFTETNPDVKHDTLRLYFADDLFGRWTEHPASPIVHGDPCNARPAGSVTSNDGTLIRYAQICAPRYGLGVNAFEISQLTDVAYQERPIGSQPFLAGTGGGWNEARMHHVNAHRLESGRWIAAVDGASNATMATIFGNT